MKHKIAYLLGLWACLLCPQIHAQNTSPPPDSLSKCYKWEVATDLLWLVKQDSILSPSIFIRRHTKDGAWRLRLGGGYKYEANEPKNPSPTAISDARIGNYIKTSMFFGRVGYQWTKKLPEFSLYYGVDLFHNRVKTRVDEYFWQNQKNFHYVAHVKKYQTGLMLFAGIQKTFCKKLSISGEVGLSTHYEYYDYLQTFYEYPIDDPDSSGWSYNTFKKWHTSLSPLYVLNFGYHF